MENFEEVKRKGALAAMDEVGRVTGWTPVTVSRRVMGSGSYRKHLEDGGRMFDSTYTKIVTRCKNICAEHTNSEGA